MKAVAYSIKPFEKEFLAKANQKKHDITLISNPLNFETAAYAAGKDAVIVFTNDDVSSKVIEKLAALGIKYIVTRSVGTDHIDTGTALQYNIKLANIPSYSPQAIAEHTIALAFALNRKLLTAYRNVHDFDFRNDGLIGFNFAGKVAGIKLGISKPKENKAVAICPGPNMAYFNRIYSLDEMVKHIYGGMDLLKNVKRPHMFIKELNLYIDYLQKDLNAHLKNLTDKKKKALANFKAQLLEGIMYYKTLVYDFPDQTTEILQSWYADLSHSEKILDQINL